MVNAKKKANEATLKTSVAMIKNRYAELVSYFKNGIQSS